MSFAPSARGETECTAASQTATVGASAAGVSPPPAPAAPSVATGGVGRQGGTPLHPSRTTVQRVNGASSPPSPVPRACSAASASSAINVVAAGAEVPHEDRTAAASSSSDGLLPALTRASPPSHGAAKALGSTVGLPACEPVSLGLPTPHRGGGDGAGDMEGREQPHQRRETEAGPPRSSGTRSSVPGESMTLPAPLPAPMGISAAHPDPSHAHSNGSQGDASGSGSRSTAPSRSFGDAYFRANNVPHLFNELSEALLEARPENPVEFMREWLQQRRDALSK